MRNKKPVQYYQTDSRWKDLPYQVDGEHATIGGSGCGPTCAAMLIETLTGQTFTPVDACRWSMEHGYKAKGQGTFYSYFAPQFAAFGLECLQMNFHNLYNDPGNLIHRDMAALLREGGYLIACMGRGLWTNSGHFVVVWWMDEESVYILDPASDKPERLRGDRELFCSQVKYYWWVDASEHNKEDEMSYEMWKEYMARYRAELAGMPVSGCAESILERAQEKGITDATRPRDFVTREEAAAMCNAVSTTT
jgi:hypothetical protein